jgi:hypothetical protein
MVELHLHFPIRLDGVMFNKLITRITLRRYIAADNVNLQEGTNYRVLTQYTPILLR